MASLQNRNGTWRILFRYKGKLHTFTLDESDTVQAAGVKAEVEELLRLLKRNLIDVPGGCSIEDFLRHRGKPPEHQPLVSRPKETTFGELRVS
jgi:hypothetical protein